MRASARRITSAQTTTTGAAGGSEKWEWERLFASAVDVLSTPAARSSGFPLRFNEGDTGS
jgi:hypothetical protein